MGDEIWMTGIIRRNKEDPMELAIMVVLAIGALGWSLRVRPWRAVRVPVHGSRQRERTGR